MLQLSKSGVNMISKELLDTVPKFKDGEVKTFKCMWGIPNNQPHLMGNPNKKPILFGHSQIPTNDRIKDPITGKHVIIGVIEDFTAETEHVTKYKTFIPGQNELEFSGIFLLREGNQDEEELYEYLYLCNYNRDNPNRNKKIEPMFYEVNSNIKFPVVGDSLVRQPKLVDTSAYKPVVSTPIISETIANTLVDENGEVAEVAEPEKLKAKPGRKPAHTEV